MTRRLVRPPRPRAEGTVIPHVSLPEPVRGQPQPQSQIRSPSTSTSSPPPEDVEDYVRTDRARALYDFTAQRGPELSEMDLVEGQVVTVVERDESGRSIRPPLFLFDFSCDFDG